MDEVRKLIVERLADLRMNRKVASIAIGRNDTYLHQFIHRGVPKELQENERHKLAAVLKVSELELRGPTTQAAQKKGVQQKSNIVANVEHPTYDATSPRNVEPVELFGKLDLPVFGTSEGANGAATLTAIAVDWASRPPALLRVRDSYGVIVPGCSMSPEHKSGSIALVNPHAKPRIGDSCIYRTRDDGAAEIQIREYRGETETAWKVRQHNPPRDFTIKRAEWPICHKTVGNYFT